MKRINHWLHVLFLLMLFFENDASSAWWNRHFRSSRNQNFHRPTMVGTLSNNFFKILSVDFTLWWWHLCNFIQKSKKSKSYLNRYLYNYQRFWRISNRKWEIAKFYLNFGESAELVLPKLDGFFVHVWCFLWIPK